MKSKREVVCFPCLFACLLNGMNGMNDHIFVVY